MIIKKLALAIIASTCVTSSLAHEVFVTADDASGSKNQNIKIQSHHRITATNNLNVDMTYQYTFKLCVFGLGNVCKTETHPVTVPAHTTKEINLTLDIKGNFKQSGTYESKALTMLEGDGGRSANAKARIIVR